MSILKRLRNFIEGEGPRADVEPGSASDIRTPGAETLMPRMDSANFPAFTFVAADGAAAVLRPGERGDYVLPVSRHLSEACPPGTVIGILAKPGPALVLNWLAAIHAGLRPLVMQYPTPRQSRQYWEDSVRNTLETAKVELILADDATAARVPEGARVIAQGQLDTLVAAAGAPPQPYTISDYAIVQLSSGTTGFRKATEFRGDALARHVVDYNRTLDLTSERDVIVSWLPLYHDMGYVACFVMPLLLGIPVVMIDPIDWVARPAMLFEAIAKHRGTICYMPNFGFEVMSRQEGPTPDCSSMRWWVSCSEPVSAVTARKFLGAIGADERLFAPCYAMAENIFAMTIRRGLATAEINGAEIVSCGPPIAGVELKLVDEEIWVRSPTSITAYMNGNSIADADGFYPTGDLGELREGELYVAGRKQDLLIQAGRKFMLSDIDLVLNRLRPEVKGRGVAVQVHDERLGTNAALVLIEAQDFFRRTDAEELAAELSRATDIDQLTVAYVPPRFLTKTSSGKFNRKKSAADWLLHKAAKTVKTGTPADSLAELKSSFPRADWQAPVGEILDSLSLTVLRIILSDARVSYDATASLSDMAKAIEAKLTDGGAEAETEEVIHIVSLADRNTTRAIKPRHLEELEGYFGRKVTFEHLCLPPLPVVLSDLIFHDYFAPRLDVEPMKAVARAIETLRSASLILVDDVAELFFSPRQVYGVLSHNLERDPRADQIAVRWQRYSQYHHRLPLTVVAGADLPYATRDRTIEAVSRYLGIPIFRIGTVRSFAAVTKGWEYRTLAGANEETGELIDADKLVRLVRRFVADRGEPLPLSDRQQEHAVASDDLAHFCSHYVDAEAMATVIDRYDRFLVVGQAASVPFLADRLAASGKTHVRAPSFAREIVGPMEEEVDAIISCGPQGKLDTQKPFFAFMSAGGGIGASANVEDKALTDLRFVKRALPDSGRDWFFVDDFDRDSDARVVRAARLANRAKRGDKIRSRMTRRDQRAERLAETPTSSGHVAEVDAVT